MKGDGENAQGLLRFRNQLPKNSTEETWCSHGLCEITGLGTSLGVWDVAWLHRCSLGPSHQAVSHTCQVF